MTLRLAVVGHTNTGKTSLLRTLARDARFGDVSDRPATTREVVGVALMVNGERAVEVYDTPGLEDSIGLLEVLDGVRESRRLDGPAQVEAFLDSDAASGRFSQEAKALRQVLAADAAIYVIDARDRVLPKHRDELQILARTGRPVVPVLNFVASEEARIAEWREQLARVNLHAVAEFDTVVYEFGGEVRLFEKIATLLDRFRPILESLIHDRRRRRDELVEGSSELIAELLLDAAREVQQLDDLSSDSVAAATERLQDALRQREQRCVEELLRLHRFEQDDLEGAELPIEGGRWGLDLFAPAALKRHGVRAGGGAAAGAAVGAGLDLAVGGLSLGAATALGAAIGAVLGAVGGEGRRLVRRARGGNELRVGDATLRLLAARQLHLARALLRRGHASQEAVRLGDAGRLDETSTEALDGVLQRLRRERDGAAPPTEAVGRVADVVEPLLEA